MRRSWRAQCRNQDAAVRSEHLLANAMWIDCWTIDSGIEDAAH
jgi:hypothetical protein